PQVERPLLPASNRVPALGPLLGPPAQDQGPEAWRLPADRHRAHCRIGEELEDLGPRSRGAPRHQEHLDALPQALRGGSAVRVRLDWDPVIGRAQADLVGGCSVELEALRAPAALYLELEIGDRAVQGVVLRPLRVGVDPAHEVAGLRRDATAEL